MGDDHSLTIKLTSSQAIQHAMFVWKQAIQNTVFVSKQAIQHAMFVWEASNTKHFVCKQASTTTCCVCMQACCLQTGTIEVPTTPANLDSYCNRMQARSLHTPAQVPTADPPKPRQATQARVTPRWRLPPTTAPHSMHASRQGACKRPECVRGG